jgi:protein phosphatase
MITVDSASLTHVGLLRKHNEDHHLCLDDLRLYIVADGLGGHQAGDVASKMTTKQIHTHLNSFNESRPVITHWDDSLSFEANCLLESIKSANSKIYQESQSNARYRGMGSTVSAVLLTNRTLIAANVGDSPIFLVRQNTIEMLSKMHTVMAEQRELSDKSDSRLPEDLSHVLTRAVGIEETVESDICEIQCFAKDQVIICSDGLSNHVTPEEIKVAVSENSPSLACRLLVNLANERGGDDNITVITLYVKKVASEKTGIFSSIKNLLRI